MRVVVVGAGLAGLTAAFHLHLDGHEVVVLEARDRVGGRVWSTRLANGEVAELGGEWIHSDQAAVLGMVRRLGLSTIEIGIDFVARDPVGDDPVAPGAHGRLAAIVTEALTSLDRDLRSELTAAELLASIAAEPSAMRVLRARLEGSAGVPLSQVGVEEIGGVFGAVGGVFHRVAGGNHRLARFLAGRLPDVRLGVEVEAIVTGNEGVAVLASGRPTLGADVAVVAVPLPVLRALHLDPAPPEPLDEAISTIAMGAAAKLAVATEEVPPLLARQQVDFPVWYWTGRGEEGRPRRVVTSFAGTRRGVDHAAEGWLDHLRQAVPEARPVGAPVVADWTLDRRAGGCYSVLGPGQSRLVDAFDRSWGRLVFAGEHTTGSGTMEGAILSGRRAATLATGVPSREET